MTEPRAIVYVIDRDIASLEATIKLLRDSKFRANSYLYCTEFLSACAVGMRGCVLLNLASAPHASVQVLEVGLLERGIDLPIILHTVNVDKQTSPQAAWSVALDLLQTRPTGRKVLNQVREAIAIDRSPGATVAR